MNRFLTILIAVGLLATACGADSSTEPASSLTTTSVPDTTTTAAATTSVPPLATTTMPAQIVGRPSAGCNGPSASGTEMRTIATADGLYREYRIHIPDSYDPGQPMPLVLNLPGAFDTVDRQLEVTRAEQLADIEGFITVVPVAYEVSAGAVAGEGYVMWNWAGPNPALVDDLAFIEQLLDQLENDTCVDLDRVFAMGMSAGAFMSTLVGCVLPDRIAAVAAVAGFVSSPACGTGRPAVVQFSGDSDEVVSIGIIEQGVVTWASDAGCSTVPDITTISVDLEVELRSYTGCDGNGEVDFYVIGGAGHRWPGDKSPLPPLLQDCCVPPECPTNGFPCLGVTTLDIDATAVAWEFFQNHPMDGSSG